MLSGEHAEVVFMPDEHEPIIWPDVVFLESEGSGGDGFRRAHVATHAVEGDAVAFLRSGFGHEVGLSPGGA